MEFGRVTPGELMEVDGQYIYYSLNTTVMDEVLRWIMQFKK